MYFEVRTTYGNAILEYYLSQLVAEKCSLRLQPFLLPHHLQHGLVQRLSPRLRRQSHEVRLQSLEQSPGQLRGEPKRKGKERKGYSYQGLVRVRVRFRSRNIVQ